MVDKLSKGSNSSTFKTVLIDIGVIGVQGKATKNYNIDQKKQTKITFEKTERGSSIGSEFAWHASGPEFDPHVRHILSWRLGHENISTAILPLPLIQETKTKSKLLKKKKTKKKKTKKKTILPLIRLKCIWHVLAS